MSDWLSRGLGRHLFGLQMAGLSTVFPPWVVVDPRICALQVFDGLFGCNDGKRLGICGWFGILQLGHQNIAMLQRVNPVTRAFNCLDVPSDSTSILRPPLWLERSCIPTPGFEQLAQGGLGCAERQVTYCIKHLGLAKQKRCVRSVFFMDLLSIECITPQTISFAMPGQCGCLW